MNTHANTPGMHLQTLVLDETFTAEQKADCLRVMKLIIKNLSDPIKAQDIKYRQLKLNNAKVQEKLVPVVSALEYLKAIGFAEAVQDDIAVLRVENPDIAVMEASLQEVTNALEMVAPDNSITKPSIKKQKRLEEEEKKSDDPLPVKRLSEKQKARRLLEEKEKKEKEIARQERAKTSAQIKQDKWVRKNDPTWKPGVSAAMAKSGSGIETFRDRHGEH